MTDGPTTINGPLHGKESTLGAPRIVAYFSLQDEAAAVRDALMEAGISADCIAISSTEDEASKLKPADQSIVGAVREKLFPDDSQQATRDAVASGDVQLIVKPDVRAVDRVVDIIQGGNPHHFDASLERWRSSPSG